MSATEETGSDLIVPLPTGQALTEIYTDGTKLAHLLDSLEKTVRDTAKGFDPVTDDGREGLRSLAYRVAQSKSAMDKAGLSLTEEWRRKTGAVNAGRKVVKDRLDALKAEVRQPVTEFEEREKERVAAHEKALTVLDVSSLPAGATLEEIEDRQRQVASIAGREWEEYADEADRLHRKAASVLKDRQAAETKRVADEAELARLRAAEAERKAKERAEVEAREAEARRSAQAEAREARLAAQAEELRASIRQYGRGGEHAENLKRMSLDGRVAAFGTALLMLERMQINDDWGRHKAILQDALDDAIDAAKRRQDEARAELQDWLERREAEAAARAVKDAEARAAAEQARRDEEARARAEAEAAEREKRAADAAYRREVRSEIIGALMAGDVPEAAAGDSADLLLAGKVPHVTVDF